jgi:D-alanyl-D-alanine carboxypeptidase
MRDNAEECEESDNLADLAPRLAEIVRDLLREGDAPGAVAALMVDGQQVFMAGIGSRDVAGAEPMPADARCYIYSTTKTLLATAALQLVAEGQLALDDDVRLYLPNLPLTAPVTLRQVLGHTGGIPDYGGMPEYFQAVRASPTQSWSPQEFLERTLAQGLVFAPGKGWEYSNIGYLIVKLLLERITGLSLRAVFERRLFAPLGLRRMFVAETLEDAQTLTPGYTAFFRRDGEPEDTLLDMHVLYHPGWVSHGVVIAPAADLAQLFAGLFAGKLLPPDLLAEMCMPTPVPHTHLWFKRPAYGLGLMLDADSPYGLSAAHGGGGPGYSAAALHCANVADHSVTSVALVNRDQRDLGMRIACALVDAVA